MHFTAIDIELANHHLSSICQIGIAVFEDGELVETWDSYIDPVEDFNPFNTKLHGIDAWTVYQAPKKHEIIDDLRHYLDGHAVVSYGLFDRHAIYSNYPDGFKTQWYDVTAIVRKVWPQFDKGGFALNKMATFLDIPQTQHHDALEDAIICGQILCEALKMSGKSLNQWPHK